jgi:hypothetical protein
MTTIIADAATAGAKIQGAGQSLTTLDLEGGGTYALNTADSGLTVDLVDAGVLDLGVNALGVEGSTGGDTLVATPGSLTSAANINLSGSNTLDLVGPGTFNLALPAELKGITTIDAQEGQNGFGAIQWTRQTLYLRNGMDATVNVASDASVNAADPNAPGITVYGADDSDTINLGTGTDTVYVGSSSETVNGGGGNDAFFVDAATEGATIDAGSGKNTLNFTGGGAVAMGSQITGISTVDLDNPASGSQPGYTFVAPDVQNLTIYGSNEGDTITVGDASQYVHTGVGTNTVIADAATAGAAVVGGTGGSTTLDLEGGGTFALSKATSNVTADLVQAGTLDLNLHALNVMGSTGGDTIVAANGDLVSGDHISLMGMNTLALQGGGTFNLATPMALGGITTVDAEEGQNGTSSIASTYQSLTMRNGQTMVVNVMADASINASNPNAAGITITGANDSDTFNLGSGQDIVYLGSSGETVNGGSGTGFVWETAALQGAAVHGGSGTVVLELEGGGTFVLGANDTSVAQVRLTGSTSAYDVTGDGQSGELINDQSSGADTLRAGAAGQTLTGGAAGMLTMEGFGSGVTTYKDSVTALNGDTIENYSANDRIDLTGLAYSKSVTVAYTSLTASSGTLNVYSGATLEASVHLFGQLAASSFSAQSDGSGGTVILDPPVQPPPALAVGH